MRKRRLFFWAIAICVITLIWLLNRQGKPVSGPLVQGADDKNTVASGNAPGPPSDDRTADAGVGTSAGMEPEKSVSPEDQVRAAMGTKNVSVDFWGKVVDQDNAPLANAQIQSQIRHWDYTTGQGASASNVEDTTTTDAGGAFHVGGSTGDNLTIKISKDDYELEPQAKVDFGFATAERFTSQPNAPVIFKMWANNIHQQLTTGQKSFQIVPDGRTNVIDLADGTISESGAGELKVWIRRPETVVLGQRYDWACQIDAMNGALLEETNVNSSMYSAPSEGYVSSFSFEQNVTSGWSDSTGPKRFYVMLNNGQEYGRITIELFAYYNDQTPGLVRVQYAINPSGSRILR